jgi:hypothetical protein
MRVIYAPVALEAPDNGTFLSFCRSAGVLLRSSACRAPYKPHLKLDLDHVVARNLPLCARGRVKRLDRQAAR